MNFAKAALDFGRHPHHNRWMARIENAPCRGLSQLFEATLKEIKEQKVLNPTGYATAISVCASCPHRQQCAADGVRYRDRHTVRAGKRLWINQERAQLLAIAEGEQP